MGVWLICRMKFHALCMPILRSTRVLKKIYALFNHLLKHLSKPSRNFMHLVYVNVSTKFAGSRTSNSYNSVTLDSLMIFSGEVTWSTSSIFGRLSGASSESAILCLFRLRRNGCFLIESVSLKQGGISYYIAALEDDSLVTSGSCFGSGSESRKYRVCSMADPLTNGGNTINRPRVFVSSSTGPL